MTLMGHCKHTSLVHTSLQKSTPLQFPGALPRDIPFPPTHSTEMSRGHISTGMENETIPQMVG